MSHKRETWEALIALLALGEPADWVAVRAVVAEARGCALLEEAVAALPVPLGIYLDSRCRWWRFATESQSPGRVRFVGES